MTDQFAHIERNHPLIFDCAFAFRLTKRTFRQPLACDQADRGIDGVAGVDKSGIGREPAHEIVDRLIAAHRFGERRARRRQARQIGELAFVGLREGDALGVGAIKIAPYRRIVESE